MLARVERVLPGHVGRTVDRMAPPGDNRLVVIVAVPAERRGVRRWARHFRGERVHVVWWGGAAPDAGPGAEQVVHHVGTSLDTVGERVLGLGAVDVLLVRVTADVLLAGELDHQSVYGSLVRHVRRRGVYVVDRRGRTRTGADEEQVMGRWLQFLAAVRGPAARKRLEHRQGRMVHSTGASRVTRDVVVVRKKVKHYAQLRYASVDELLPAREPGVSVARLVTLPAGEYGSRARVHQHGCDGREPDLPETIRYPSLDVRHYEGRIAFSGGLLMHVGHSILPESFRWPFIPNPRHPRLQDHTAGFATMPGRYLPKRELAGSYYQMDNTFPGHFGHVMTEVVSRMWGWQAAKAAIPDLKVICTRKRHRAGPPHFMLALCGAFGIDESDVVWVREPVWLESLVSAGPMWQNADPYHAHPGLVDVWDRLRSGFGAAPTSGQGRRIFVGRGESTRARVCRNAAEVHALFERHGFEVVFPERLGFAEQAALFADASVVAGFGGSAMFNLMYSTRRPTTIVLSHTAYTARNEHLYASLIGGDLHYFWSSPDVQHPPGVWRLEAFVSDWEFDLRRHRDDLEDLLASL